MWAVFADCILPGEQYLMVGQWVCGSQVGHSNTSFLRDGVIANMRENVSWKGLEAFLIFLVRTEIVLVVPLHFVLISSRMTAQVYCQQPL